MFHLKLLQLLRVLNKRNRSLYNSGYVGNLNDVNISCGTRLFQISPNEIVKLLECLKDGDFISYDHYSDEYVDHYENVTLTYKGLHYIEFAAKFLIRTILTSIVTPIIVSVITTLITLKLTM